MPLLSVVLKTSTNYNTGLPQRFFRRFISFIIRPINRWNGEKVNRSPFDRLPVRTGHRLIIYRYRRVTVWSSTGLYGSPFDRLPVYTSHRLIVYRFKRLIVTVAPLVFSIIYTWSVNILISILSRFFFILIYQSKFFFIVKFKQKYLYKLIER